MLKLNCKTKFKFKNDDSSSRMVFAGLTKDSVAGDTTWATEMEKKTMQTWAVDNTSSSENSVSITNSVTEVPQALKNAFVFSGS